MEEKETINEFTTIIMILVNKVKACGKTITQHYMVSKILRSLTSRFDNIVIAIKEFVDLSTMRKTELQRSPEANELIMVERDIDKAKVGIALQACFIGKEKKVKVKWSMNTSRGHYQNNGGRDS